MATSSQPAQMVRKLAAIMLTDIVGYTSIMSDDEKKAIKILDQNRKLQQALVNEFNGRWLKEMGDGVIISFDSVLDAIQCAIKIQNHVREEDFSLKIAIHSGEVLFKDKDVYGDGINLTARLEQLSSENSIVISDKAYGEIRNIKSIKTTFLGAFLLKNIREPVKIYAISDEGLSLPDVSDLPPGKARKVDPVFDFQEEISETKKMNLRGKVDKIIGENINNSQFSVELLSKLMGISRPQLYRKIHGSTGFSPNDYIREFRLQKAAQLLKSGSGNVSEVAYQVGFNNLSYFTRCFNERFGSLPSEFEKSGSSQEDLPTSLNQFIGRDQEIREIIDILTRTRLLTLTGPGGTGKTRLSEEILRLNQNNFQDGIYYVQLAPVAEVDQVLPRIAQTLKIIQNPVKTIEDTIINFIKTKEILLLLDNFEHIIEASPKISTLLKSCPNLKIMVTSRNVLNIQGEYEYEVPPLPLPEKGKIYSLEEIATIPSIQLLINRARAVKKNFELTEDNKEDIASICIQLDGLPLALELAAARIKLFSPQALNKRLVSQLDILKSASSDQPDRHRTLRNAIDWSYNLLQPEEQTLFRRLSVFSGGFTIEAAEEVCLGDYIDKIDILDGLGGLVDKSLVQRTEQADGEPRFYMLETIKAFGLERLERSMEKEKMMNEYCQYYQKVVEKAQMHLTGPEQGIWLDILELDLDNIRAVLAWVEKTGNYDMGLSIVVSFWRFWAIRSMMREGAGWMKRMLEIPGIQNENELRCRALNAYGIMYALTHKMKKSIDILNKSLVIARKMNYLKELGDVLNHLGWVHQFNGDYEKCIDSSNEALRINETIDNFRGIAVSYNNLAWITRIKGDLKKAISYQTKSTSFRNKVGDIRGYAYSLVNEAWIDMHAGDYQDSDKKTDSALNILLELSDNQLIAWAKSIKAYNCFYRKDFERAKKLSLEAQPLWDDSDNSFGLSYSKLIYVLIMMEEGNFDGMFELLCKIQIDFSNFDTYYSYHTTFVKSLLEYRRNNITKSLNIIQTNIKDHISKEYILLICDEFELLSTIFCHTDKAENGVVLLSLAAKLRHQISAPIPPVYRKYYEWTYDTLKLTLGPAGFDKYWKNGHKITLKESKDFWDNSIQHLKIK